MKHIPKSEVTPKKKKVKLQKVKRFSSGSINQKSTELSSTVDSDVNDFKIFALKNVQSPRNVDSKKITVLSSSEHKKVSNKRKSTSKWEVSELLTTACDRKLEVTNDRSASKVISNEKKISLPAKKAVKSREIVIGQRRKLNKKSRRKDSDFKKVNSFSASVCYSDINESIPVADSAVSLSTCNDPLVTGKEVEKATRALLQLIKVTAEKRGPSLFESEAEPVQMQITSIRVPITPMRRIRFSLPHPMLTDTSDVCLFVPDLKKGARIDHEPTVAHYRELLDKYGVKGITQIMPVRQLKDEYFQYETRRRLCNSFDIFLADGRICGPINSLLGKEFQVKRKLPTPVNLQSKHMKEAIEHALTKTPLTVSSRGDSTLVKIGHTLHSPQQLTENIMHVIEELKTKYPGGWQNIRALNLKTARSLRIPLYVTMKPANNVKVPVVKPKRPRAAVPVEDELSTIPGARVIVMPSGEVIVKKEPTDDDIISNVESEEELQDDDGNEDEEENVARKNIEAERKKIKKDKKADSRKKKEGKKADSRKRKGTSDSDEGDSEVEAAEEEYLSGWLQEFQETENTKEKMNEPAKKKPKLQNDSAKHGKSTKVKRAVKSKKMVKKTKAKRRAV